MIIENFEIFSYKKKLANLPENASQKSNSQKHASCQRK